MSTVKFRTYPANDSYYNIITCSVDERGLSIDDGYDVISVNVEEIPVLLKAIKQAYDGYLDKTYLDRENDDQKQ